MIFYKPSDGWCGDFIPFYWDGAYHLFYLKDHRDEKRYGKGMSWYHIATRDFVTFTDHGEALRHGDAGDQDLYVFTGCVIEKDCKFHAFYTGHNPEDNGRPNQAVMHAISDDLIFWEKDPELIIWADEARYERDDWRDPFVFWNPKAKEYWMLLAARLRKGPSNRRGCIALVSSSNLADWEMREPFWAPGLYHTHECPDLFRWGDWWYLIYSTFTERFVTHYRKSGSLDGPWTAPANDTFDGRAYYAAKTAGDGMRRFAFGWNPTRDGNSYNGSWQWGGNLVVHEILQAEDGRLHVTVPPEVDGQFSKHAEAKPEPKMGKWQIGPDTIAVDSMDAFSWCKVGEMPEECSLATTINWMQGTRACGVVLRSDPYLENYYLVRLEPGSNRIFFDRWPRSGDQPFMLDRPLDLSAGKSVSMKILVDGSIVEIYADDKVAISTRAYDNVDGFFGLFVSEGGAMFDKPTIKVVGQENP